MSNSSSVVGRYGAG